MEFIRSLGVEFRYGVEVGDGHYFEELEREYDAIFSALGLGKAQPWAFPVRICRA